MNKQFICDKCGHPNQITKPLRERQARPPKSRIRWRWHLKGKTLTQVIADEYSKGNPSEVAEINIEKLLNNEGIMLTNIQRNKVHRSVLCRYSELDSSLKINRK